MDIAVMQILKYVGWELVLQVIQGQVRLENPQIVGVGIHVHNSRVLTPKASGKI